MPNIIYNGDFGVRPLFTIEFIRKSRAGKKAELAEERAKQEQDRIGFQTDIQNSDPELAFHAQKRIDRIDRRLTELNEFDASL